MLKFNQFVVPISPKQKISDTSLIYIHGIGGSYAVWYFQYMLYFYGKCHQLAYDMRGHGKSEYPHDGYTVSDHAHDLYEIANQSGVSKPRCFVGYSYGGCILLEYAVKYATPEDKLIIVDAPFYSRINSQLVDDLIELRLSMLGEVAVPVGDVATEFKASMGEIDPKSRTISRYADRLKRLLATRFPEQCIDNAFPTPEQLAKVPCEVLLVYASHGECMPCANYLAQYLSRNRLTVLEAKHDLVATHHATIINLIQEFIVD